MNKATDPVLEFLREHDIGVPIGVLDNNLDPARQTIDDALNELIDKGFVECDDNYSSHYRITDRGHAYLDGEVDASNY